MKKNLKKFQHIFAVNFFVKPDAVDFSKSFQQDFRLNESEFVAMIAYTENAFHIQIADNEIPKLRRVRDIVKYISQNTN
jgi:acyl carrier protein